MNRNDVNSGCLCSVEERKFSGDFVPGSRVPHASILLSTEELGG